LLKQTLQETLQAYLESGGLSIDLEERDGEGETALLRLLHGQMMPEPSMITMLLNHGANVAARNFSGQGCLHTILLNNAAYKAFDVRNLAESLPILLDRGADIYAINESGASVTAYAMEFGHANTWFESLATSTHGYDVREVLVQDHYNYHSYERKGAERRSEQSDVPEAETREDLNRWISDCGSENADSEDALTCSNCDWIKFMGEDPEYLYFQFLLKQDQDGLTSGISQESFLEKANDHSRSVNSEAESAENEDHLSRASSCTGDDLLLAAMHSDIAVGPWVCQAVDSAGNDIDHSTLPPLFLEPDPAMYFNPWVEPAFTSHTAWKTRLT